MMRKRQKNSAKLLLLIIGLAISFAASAQKSFKYQAILNQVDSTGFYKISMGPDIIRKSNNDLSDIRLMDPKGNFVPYVTQSNLPQVEKQRFTVFPQIEVNSSSDTGTAFIVENISKHPVGTLWIKLKNTAVSRLINLSGSDDLKNWYAIEESIPLQESVLNSDGTYEQSLSFPVSNYHYLKLLVNDKNKTPVKFLAAGEYDTKSAASVVYLPVPAATFTKKDSNKVTYLTIRLGDNYLVNRLHLTVAAPQFYKREVSIYQANKYGDELISATSLRSDTNKDIFISAKTNKLVLQIENGDNLPLDIKDIKVYQAEQYIVGYLEKGKIYRLFTGDENATIPEYDLKFFTDSINNIKSITAGAIASNGIHTDSLIIAKKEYTIFIWIAIIVALLLLSLLTVKMMKEVNNKKA